MLPNAQGSIALFRFAGIRVYLHWSWFLVAIWALSNRAQAYESGLWNAAEYLSLFGIVLMHEYGHALACRQTGGRAETIVLWPLGGVAYVDPPPRPGPVLWSIAAGPLVNVALFPLLWFARGAVFQAAMTGQAPADAARFIESLFYINTAILVFNLLPVYPLDGGQILRALLWFGLGPVRSLLIAAMVGFIGVAGLGWLAYQWQSIWLGILALFIASMCWRAFQQARFAMQAMREGRAELR